MNPPAPPRRRWFRFSLRTLFVLVTILGGGLGWLMAKHGLAADDGLYGLYEGVPRTEWGADWAIGPNKITLFRLPLEEDFPDPDELRRQIRRTVVHEIAHYFGMDDDEIDDLGY